MSSNPFAELGDESVDQIRKYLRFFRQKRDGIVRMIAREFDDAKADRIHEDMYSREDMEEFADFLKSCITTQMNADLTAIINMGALSVSQLLESAQEKGAAINLETSAVENQQLLEAVEKMSLDAIPKTNAKKMGALTSMKEEAKAMKESMDQLEGENARLREELQACRSRLASAERQGSEGKQREEDTRDSSHSRIRALEQDLREAKEESEKRVSDTVQFQQMRKLMQSQSQNMTDLRRRLAKYEPDDAKGE